MSVKPIEVQGTYEPAWADRGMTGAFTYRARVESLEGDHRRTLSIGGKVRNVPSKRDGGTAIEGRTDFEHGGHLIAARFGGPTSAGSSVNVVRMHGAINMSGGAWFRMEEEIKKLLGNQEGTMFVDVNYDGPLDEVPSSFQVFVGTPDGQRFTQRMENGNPLLLPPTHPELWRMRIIHRLKGRRIRITKEARAQVLGSRDLDQLQRWCERVDRATRLSDVFP